MKKYLTTFFLIAFIVPNISSAIIIDTDLSQQLEQLKKQFIQKAKSSEWCFNFTSDFYTQGSWSEDRDMNTLALHIALTREGFDITNDIFTNTYDTQTSKAVSGLKSKYGLKDYGSLNKETRIKLNELYSCETVDTSKDPSVTLIYPNKGETLERGKTYEIKWRYSGEFPENLSENSFIYVMLERKGAYKIVLNSSDYGNGIYSMKYSPEKTTYSWTIPSDQDISGEYLIDISVSSKKPLKVITSDTSDTPFFIKINETEIPEPVGNNFLASRT